MIDLFFWIMSTIGLVVSTKWIGDCLTKFLYKKYFISSRSRDVWWQ